MQHGSYLYSAGISYFSHGIIKNGRKVQAYFFKLNKPASSEQIASLREKFPHVSTGYGFSEFAPELRRQVLIFPSAAELKRQGQKPLCTLQTS
jgi:hypothetical protein